MADRRDKRRKVTEEEVARINRRRHLVDERGRAAEYERHIPPEWIQWS